MYKLTFMEKYTNIFIRGVYMQYNINQSEIKMYRAFYQSMTETMSCVILFLNENKQLCINDKTSDIIQIKGILGFMIEKEISELEELYMTENLINIVDQILVEYVNDEWILNKDFLIKNLFAYLNGPYLSQINNEFSK